MRIRLKLLLLLLFIALVPLLTVTWYDLRAIRQLGFELSARAADLLTERAADQILASARESASLMRKERELLEAAVDLQARAAERLLSPGGERLAREFERIRRLHAPLAAAQRIAVADGLVASFPPSVQQVGQAPQALPWYRLARERAGSVWIGPATDGATEAAILTVAARFDAADGIAGATAIEVRLADLFAAATGEFAPAHALLVEPAADRPALRVIAERNGEAVEAADALLTERELTGLPDILGDMAADRSAVHRAELGGETVILAHAGIGDLSTRLMVVVPYREVVAEVAGAQDYVLDLLARQRAMLWLGVAVLVPAVIGVSLFASRAVTLPVRQLAESARRLARGDFGARARIRSGDELEELGRLFNVMVPQLYRSLRMRESLALAQEVQQNLLPRRPPEVERLDIAGLSIYCDETGGDYYDYLPVPGRPSAVALAVGDVTGHGIAAALLMTTVRALLRSHEPIPGRLAEVVGDVNRRLAADVHGGRFMTLFLAVVDAERREAHWVGAGHSPALLYNPADDTLHDFDGPDIPLGIDPGWRYQELSDSGWPDGAIVVIGTDGVWETRDSSGRMIGRAAVAEVVRANSHRRAEDIARAITEALAAFRGARPQEDDVTLVVAKAV